MRAEAGRIILGYRYRYRYRVAGGEWQDVDEPIRIVRAPCGLAGNGPISSVLVW